MNDLNPMTWTDLFCLPTTEWKAERAVLVATFGEPPPHVRSVRQQRKWFVQMDDQFVRDEQRGIRRF